MGAEEDYRVPGFQAAATSAGVKQPEALDLALIYSKTAAVAAGVAQVRPVTHNSNVLAPELPSPCEPEKAPRMKSSITSLAAFICLAGLWAANSHRHFAVSVRR